MFSKSPKKSRTLLRARTAQRVARVASARRSATSGVDARASTLHYAKTLVFLSRCSNPNAVFAIPAGTVRHRHSLMARRAAWRRSERRRRSRRRKRAQGRPSAGRRSKHAPLPSLRLRTTSMTASNGPARVEERSAHRDRASTPPVPVDDRGRRRDRGSSFTGFRAAAKVKERGRRFPHLAVGSSICRGLGSRPLTDALGVPGARPSGHRSRAGRNGSIASFGVRSGRRVLETFLHEFSIGGAAFHAALRLFLRPLRGVILHLLLPVGLSP